MVQRMDMKVITLVTIMHEIKHVKEISILYIQSMLADCLSLPVKMRAKCLLHINVSF